MPREPHPPTADQTRTSTIIAATIVAVTMLVIAAGVWLTIGARTAIAATALTCPSGPITQSVRESRTAHLTVECLPAHPVGSPVTHRFAISPGSTTLATTSGTATMIDASTGEISYTPDLGFTGTDSFVVEAIDEDAGYDSVTVTITVTPNTAPTCATQSVTTTHDTALDVTIVCSDGDGDPITHALVVAALHGSVSQAVAGSPTFHYTPQTGFAGEDTFSIAAADDLASSTPAIMHVTVSNHAPTCTPPTSVSTRSFLPVTIILTCADADGDATSLITDTPPRIGSATVIDASHVIYRSRLGVFGSDTVHLIAIDGVSSVPVTVPVRVDPALVATLFPTGVQSRAVTLRVACPSQSLHTCTGTAIASFKLKSRIITSRSCAFSVAAGRTSSIRCALPSSQRSRIRRARKKTVLVTVAGRPRDEQLVVRPVTVRAPVRIAR